jgi:hypothetical protein
MNKKALTLFMGLLTLAMLAAPVMAIGPQNSKNPNVDFLPYGVSLPAPSGIVNEWVNYGTPIPKHFTWMSASEFKIGKAIEITSTSEVANLENKWIFFSMVLWETWMIEHGIPAPIAHMIASRYPEGVYYRESWIGQ